MIKLSGRTLVIDPAHKSINVQSDNNAESIEISVPRYYGETDLSEYSMYLKTVSVGGRDDVLLTQTVNGDTITATWTLCPPQTSYNGKLALQLYFSGTGFKFESFPAEIEIITSLDATPAVPATPSAYEAWLAEVQAEAGEAANYKDAAARSAEDADAAKDAAVDAKAAAELAVGKTSYIGENGNWYEWDSDTGAFVDSGVAAQGERGIQGIQGERGLQGLKGDKGDKGDRGEPGQDAPQESILYTSQTLTAPQKEQARGNIGAITEAEANTLINESYLRGTSAPTTLTAADFVGQLYVDTAAGKTYQCDAIANGVYTWVRIIRSTDNPSDTDAGAVKVNSGWGINVNSQLISIFKASPNEINSKTHNYRPIVPASLDYAVRAGLLSNAEITDADKPTICGTIGAKYDGQYELIEKIIIGYSLTTEEPADWAAAYTSYFINTGTAREPVYTAVTGDTAPAWAAGTYYAYDAAGVKRIDRTVEPDGTTYNFTEQFVRIIFPNMAVSTQIGGIMVSNACYWLGSYELMFASASHRREIVAWTTYRGGMRHIYAYNYPVGNSQLYVSTVGQYSMPVFYTDDPIITSLQVSATYAVPFPSGTVIEYRAVRA